MHLFPRLVGWLLRSANPPAVMSRWIWLLKLSLRPKEWPAAITRGRKCFSLPQERMVWVAALNSPLSKKRFLSHSSLRESGMVKQL